jgi:hypothetical protein
MARSKPKNKYVPRVPSIRDVLGLRLLWSDADPLATDSVNMFAVKVGHKNNAISGKAQSLFRKYRVQIMGNLEELEKKNLPPIPLFWRVEISMQYATTECVEWEYQPDEPYTVNEINEQLVSDIDEVLTMRIADSDDFECVNFRLVCVGFR